MTLKRGPMRPQRSTRKSKMQQKNRKRERQRVLWLGFPKGCRIYFWTQDVEWPFPFPKYSSPRYPTPLPYHRRRPRKVEQVFVYRLKIRILPRVLQKWYITSSSNTPNVLLTRPFVTFALIVFYPFTPHFPFIFYLPSFTSTISPFSYFFPSKLASLTDIPPPPRGYFTTYLPAPESAVLIPH